MFEVCINEYKFEIFDKDNNLINSHILHNLGMFKRYAVDNVNNLVLKLGTMLPSDELKYQDNDGNWLPGTAESSKDGRSNNKPASASEVDKNGDKVWTLKLSPSLNDTGLFGTTITTIPIKWKSEDMSNNPSSFLITGEGEWGYHSFSNRLNRQPIKKDTPTIELVDTKFILGIKVNDSGLFSNAGTMYTHVDHSDVELIKRPTDRLVVTVTIRYAIDMSNTFSQGTKFLPMSSSLFGHGFNSANNLLPQFFPSSVGFSNLIPQNANGSFCYPIKSIGNTFRFNRLVSEVIKVYAPTDSKGNTIFVDDGWGETDILHSNNNKLSKDYGEWFGFPVFYYIGTPYVSDAPETITLPGPEQQVTSVVNLPPEAFQTSEYQKYFDTPTGVVPNFTYQQWIVHTHVDPEDNKLKPILYYRWEVTTYAYDDNIKGVKATTKTIEETELIEHIDIIYDEIVNDKVYRVGTIYKKANPFRAYKFNRTTIKHPMYKTIYYNWKFLKPTSFSIPYTGPARSIIYNNYSAKKYTQTENYVRDDKGVMGLGGVNNDFGSITIQIAKGDGSTTVFAHPFIKEGDWQSGEVTNAFSLNYGASKITHYKPDSILPPNFKVYDKQLQNLLMIVTNGEVVKNSINTNYSSKIGYHKNDKYCNYEICHINLKYYPLNHTLGAEETIVIEGDWFGGKTLSTWIGAGTALRIDRWTGEWGQLSRIDYISDGAVGVYRLPHNVEIEPNSEVTYTTITTPIYVAYYPQQFFKFFEPSDFRASIKQPIEGFVEFSTPPPYGVPVYINVKLLAPFFLPSTKLSGRVVYKMGQKNYNGTIKNSLSFQGPKQNWMEDGAGVQPLY